MPCLDEVDSHRCPGAVHLGRECKSSQWLAEVAAKQVRAATYTGYETNIQLHIEPLIGSKKLTKLTARDVRQMVEALQTKPLSRGTGIMSDRTVQYVHATLRAALEQACREELIPRNVAKLVQASVRDAKQHEPYPSEESKQLLIRAERHRMHALWVLLVMLGMRRGEPSHCAGPMWTSTLALLLSWAACSGSGTNYSGYRPRPTAPCGRSRCPRPALKH